MSDAFSVLTEILDELQHLARGIHPGILSEGGLGPAVKMLARRSAVPVELDVQVDRRLPEQIEVATYYVVSEGLTNVTKHAHASVAHVEVKADDAVLHISIRDDGIGGADPNLGSGITGLRDRVETVGGKIELASAPGIGTSLLATLPLN